MMWRLPKSQQGWDPRPAVAKELFSIIEAVFSAALTFTEIFMLFDALQMHHELLEVAERQRVVSTMLLGCLPGSYMVFSMRKYFVARTRSEIRRLGVLQIVTP
ncbi:hypothetical protein SAMN05421853_11583 [Roseivivax halotolerans]|uniref:Uncharacterized protein n=1 Tax=Roseivivax halotolerans TaxID=93684 RepID=A0A1I6A7I4_9RHOB|nr:hypothetical protein [Roseivivax halotolerans]SFQ64593.1 hypothetical protein SAMN05421853_11583 [Roseivivax halotolerans]